jgi:hypothetical protein
MSAPTRRRGTFRAVQIGFFGLELAGLIILVAGPFLLGLALMLFAGVVLVLWDVGFSDGTAPAGLAIGPVAADLKASA